MGRSRANLTRRLELQLTIAFVAVALAAVTLAIVIAALTIGGGVNHLVSDHQSGLAKSAAVAAGAAYRPSGWEHADLSPIVAFIDRSGAAVGIRSMSGRLVRASPGFHAIAFTGPRVTDKVTVDGRQVGWVTVAYDHGTFTRAIAIFNTQRWRSRLVAGAIAVALAILVALPLSRLVAKPLDRLTWAARARGGGDAGARAGEVRGLGKLRELCRAFDQMVDASEEQDQVRRNLVADVAHELRTPIAVLQAGHEAMLDGLAPADPEHIASLRDEVLRLARMADDLQRLASAEAAALELTLVRRDLAAVAATAATSLVDSFEVANVTLVERLTKVEVMCDPLRMHEVVVNLLTNALKFTPSGGQVKLETLQSDDSGRLLVRDTGIGIPPEELPRITERFYRGESSSQVAGSGIGLAIVSELISAHQGLLDIESEPGRGTSVTVTLPLVSRNWPGERKSHRPNPLPPGSKRRHAGIFERGKPPT